MIIYQYFPQEFLDLQQEIIHHPELQELIANHPSSEFEVRIAEIATYCKVILDDTYDEEDIKRLCKILTKRLIEKRTKFLLPPIAV
jgi:hypothetical protein